MNNISSLLKRLNTFEDKINKQTNANIIINDSRMVIHASQEKIYIPSPTGHIAHMDDAFVRVIMGPYGSGKSTWAVSEIVRRSCQMPVWADGNRRRSRWAIVRNTSGELQSTTLQTWLAWFGELGDITKRQKPILTYEYTFNDGYGLVELELLFIALDREEDVRKIKSLELTGCYINELSEVPQAALAHMKGRVNRYPSHAFCKIPYWSGIIADTNPPDEDHWIYKNFEEKQIESNRLFKQPPGLIKNDGVWITNPHADNIANLSHDYYEKLAEGQTQEFINVFCLGKYGTVGFGKLVFTDFNSDLHAVDNLEAIQGEPLYLGWDFGLTPACVVVQLSPRGRLMVLKEYIGIGIGIRNFAESIVIPGLMRDFPYCKVGKSVGDPSGSNRDQIMEEMSCLGELNSLGIPTIGARTNKIDPRLGAIRYFLNKMIDGKPAFVIDKRKCPVLYKGFIKEYVYKRVAIAGEERYKDEPDKNMASHPMDGLGYDCLELASDHIMQEKTQNNSVDMYNPVMRIFN